MTNETNKWDAAVVLDIDSEKLIQYIKGFVSTRLETIRRRKVTKFVGLTLKPFTAQISSLVVKIFNLISTNNIFAKTHTENFHTRWYTQNNFKKGRCLFSYKMETYQELLPSDHNWRMLYCQSYINSQTMKRRSAENPHICRESPLHSQKVRVWIGFSQTIDVHNKCPDIETTFSNSS